MSLRPHTSPSLIKGSRYGAFFFSLSLAFLFGMFVCGFLWVLVVDF